MRDETKFVIVYFLALIFVRIYCFLKPETSSFYNDNWHHIYAGFLVIGLMLLLRAKEFIPSKNKAILIYGAAIALIMDELILLFVPGFTSSKASYFSTASIAGVVITSVAVVFKRKAIVKRIIRKG